MSTTFLTRDRSVRLQPVSLRVFIVFFIFVRPSKAERLERFAVQFNSEPGLIRDA